MQVNVKAAPIIVLLFKIMEKNKKDYCFPSQKKILELLDIRQGIKQSRATLNRWLRVIEDEGYIIRRRRIKRDPVHGMMFKSTLYFITLKGCRLLTRMGVKCRSLFDKVLNKIKSNIPGAQARETKKMLDGASPNINHGGKINKILNSLAENLSVAP